MADLARYESLLAIWREKEEIATRMREFRDTGGRHRLRVSVVQADPTLGAVAGPAINDLMVGAGWQKMVDLAVARAESAAAKAREAFEREAVAEQTGVSL